MVVCHSVFLPLFPLSTSSASFHCVVSQTFFLSLSSSLLPSTPFSIYRSPLCLTFYHSTRTSHQPPSPQTQLPNQISERDPATESKPSANHPKTVGNTVTGVTGSYGKPVGDALNSLGNGVEDGTTRVARGVEDAGKGKKTW